MGDKATYIVNEGDKKDREAADYISSSTHKILGRVVMVIYESVGNNTSVE